uniref:Uncharacterized protein n=1 Tax=Poecilia latipinna TaxID=48699 RepID=A0A3B3TZ22_9TELE
MRVSIEIRGNRISQILFQSSAVSALDLRGHMSSTMAPQYHHIIVLIFFLLVLGIGFLAMQQANRGTVRGYFKAASLLVSTRGSEHFIGLVGFSVAAWEFNTTVASVAVYIQCWSLHSDRVPVQTIGRTVPEGVFSALSLILYIYTMLSVNLYSGAPFIQESLGWNLYLSIIPPHHNDSCAESRRRTGTYLIYGSRGKVKK